MEDNSAARLYNRFRETDGWRRKVFSTFLCTSVIVFGFYCLLEFGPPIRSILQHKDKLLEAQIQGLQAIPDIQEKITSLNEQAKVLSSSSIENRLQTIETAMRVGDVKPEQIATIEDMRKEVETLKSYMFSDPKALVDLKQLEKDYGDLNSSLKNCPTSSEIDSKINSAKDLMYLSWALFGLPITFLIFFGPKIFGRKGPIPTEPVSNKVEPVVRGGQ